MKMENLVTCPSGTLDFKNIGDGLFSLISLRADAQQLENLIKKLHCILTPEFIGNAIRRDIIENTNRYQLHENELDKALSFFSFSASLKSPEYTALKDLVSNIGSSGANTYKFRFDDKTYNSINQVIIALVSKLANSLNYGYADLKRLFAMHNVTDSIMKLESEITGANRRKYPNFITLNDNVKVRIWNNWYFHSNFQPILEMSKAMGFEIKILS